MSETASSAEERETQEEASERGQMSFLEHLEELRKRLFLAAMGVLLGVVVSWIFAEQLLSLLLKPVSDAFGDLTIIRPAEAFLNKVKAALVGGIFVALPWIFYQIWAFVAPGLYKRERRWVIPVVMSATFLFAAGAGFCYIVALPAAAGFLAEQGEIFSSNITVDYAFGFATKLLLGLGVVFQLPLIMFALSRMGLVTAGFLIKRIDVAAFLCFLVAAIITPTPDIMTMTIFAVPMLVLYLVGIGVAFLAAPRQRDEE